MLKKQLKSGSVGLMAFTVVLLIASSVIFLDTYERHTLLIKKQNIENKLTSIDLSTYTAVRAGDRSKFVNYTLNEIDEFGYCLQGKTINEMKSRFADLESREHKVFSSNGTTLAEAQKHLLSLYSTSFFNKDLADLKYRSIYIDTDVALGALTDYMAEELRLYSANPTQGITEEGTIKVYKPASTDTSNPIAEIDVTEFFVRNAVPFWDADQSGGVANFSRKLLPYSGFGQPCNSFCEYVRDSEYTAIHMEFVVKIKTSTKMGEINMFKNMGFAYKDTTDLTLHYDTLIDFTDSVQNNSQSKA